MGTEGQKKRKSIKREACRRSKVRRIWNGTRGEGKSRREGRERKV